MRVVHNDSVFGTFEGVEGEWASPCFREFVIAYVNVSDEFEFDSLE